MEEELNEDEIEERLYAILHYGDTSQPNVETTKQNAVPESTDNTSRSTLRRYWRISSEFTPINNQYQKVNQIQNVNTPQNTNINKNNAVTKPKQEQQDVNTSSPKVNFPTDLSVFQSPITKDTKTTIKFIENDDSLPTMELETSDEDEVVEVALPPKPTITIESSDEEDLSIVTPEKPTAKSEKKDHAKNVKKTDGDREVSASPVPSVVSSVSDEFIRGDCIALNISSRRPDNCSFDFSLHGSDLLGTPSRKKKKKKNKDRDTSTPIVNIPDKVVDKPDECFATPKNKSKSKKLKNKSYSVTEKSVPCADIYDSDSNQSIDNSKKDNLYSVSDKSLPSMDVYESDSSQSDIVKTKHKNVRQNKSNEIESSDSSSSFNVQQKSVQVSNETKVPIQLTNPVHSELSVIDLTEEVNNVVAPTDKIEENIVMANVSGFEESNDYEETNVTIQTEILGSTKVPAILSADLDFDLLKGNNSVQRHPFTLETLRADMEKFYNESWGGENFNHREIQKSMSRDKSLWEIDPKDRLPTSYKKKVTCNYCHRPGHKDDSCRMKPAICHMCGDIGHYEPRCPHKICVNCGSPNHMYSTICRNCSNWPRITCMECKQVGHPSSHCPDLWRRYHDTIDNNMPLVESHRPRKYYQQYCSGCTRRGHLVHNCRLSLPFSGLPINSPYVVNYRPLHPPTQNRNFARQTLQQDINRDTTMTPKNSERNKRQSKSPTCHETHVNKKRTMSAGDVSTEKNASKDNAEISESSPFRLRTVSENRAKTPIAESTETVPEKAPDFIPIPSTNHDKLGQMIQDNEVSDTSDAVTSARIYVTNEIVQKFKTKEGEDWLREKITEHNVDVTHSDINLFLNIKGKLADQEAFQTVLRDWTAVKSNDSLNVTTGTDPETENESGPLSENIPKNRNNLLRKLTKAFESLKKDIGDPKHLYNELNFFQNNHSKLLKQKVISPQKLNNNKNHIKDMLKKLNMVLLGQAGLADGSKHLDSLHSLQEKLSNSRQKNIPMELRKEVGEHYHCIFTAVPRDDYEELLSRFYMNKKTPRMSKKHKKIFKSPGAPEEKMLINPLSPMANEWQNNKNVMNGQVQPKENRVLQKTLNKMTFFHRRLLSTKPVDAVLKKTRHELVRKFHMQISSLGNKTKVTSKNLKKLKKLQEQANLFLSNNV